MAIFQKIIRLLSKIQHRVFTGIALSALCSVHPFVVYWREGEPGVMCRVTAASLMAQSTAPLWCVHFCSILCPQYERRYQIEVLSFWHRRTGAGTIHGTGGAKAGTTPADAGTMPVPIQNNNRTPTTKTHEILLNKVKVDKCITSNVAQRNIMHLFAQQWVKMCFRYHFEVNTIGRCRYHAGTNLATGRYLPVPVNWWPVPVWCRYQVLREK